MYKIFIHHDCYLCGAATVEKSQICRSCQSHISLIESEICISCGIPLISEEQKCLRCRSVDFSFQKNRSLFEYRNFARDVFYQYKFKRHKRIAYLYASLMSALIHRESPNCIIVPSPYSFYKKLNKGWDQVDFLCSIFRRKYKLPVVPVLKKSIGKDQKKLDLENRRTNLRGRIRIKEKFRNTLNGNVIFIDDIFTTGATAGECSCILKQNGAKNVTVLTIAID